MPVHSAQNPDRNRSTHRQVARVRRLPLLNINRIAAVFAGGESVKYAALSFLLLLFMTAQATEPTGKNGQRRQTVWVASRSWFTINNVASQFANDGSTDRYLRPPDSGGSGLFFPKRSDRTVVFQAGVMWTAKLRDTFYVGGSNYISGLQPGRILLPGVAEDPFLPKNRVYRVRPDYATADLSDEAYFEHQSVDEIRSQYAIDWLDWPAHEGAPFEDRNHNGTYEPSVDLPGRPGADQTLWYVANDLDTLLPYPEQSLRRKAMGVEVQVTIWGYRRGGVLDNVIFRQYRFINKSTVAFDSMYVMQWADPDLGDYGDDFAGCDSALQLQYVYNSAATDRWYSPMPPPAMGYQFLNAGTVSSVYDAVYSTAQFWPTFSHRYAPLWNNLMRGLRPSGQPFIHPLFPNQPTRYWLDGDPITGMGRVDGTIDGPGDRRIGSSVGPFRLLPNESKDVVIASLAAIGGSRLSSVILLKRYAQALLSMSNALSQSVPPKFDGVASYPSPSQATVQLLADGRPTRARSIAAHILRQSGEAVATIPLFDDGAHGDGGSGDGIWGNAITLQREQQALYTTASTVDSAGRSFTWERIHDNITTAGRLRLANPRVFSDNINSDGVVNPRENIRYGFSLVNATPFALGGILVSSPQREPSKYIGQRSVGAGAVDSLLYSANDPLSFFSFDAPESGTQAVALAIADSNFNRWMDTVRFDVHPFRYTVYGTPLNHVAGNTEWQFNVRVVEPGAVRDRDYEITFGDSVLAATDSTPPVLTKVIYLRDLVSGDTLMRRHPLPDELGHNIPVTHGFKISRGQVFGHVGLRRDSTRWISATPAWLDGDNRFFDEHSAFNGGVTTGYQLSILYLGSVQSNFDPYRSFPIEVRFDSTRPQKAYRLRRFNPSGGGGSQYYIQSPNPFVDVPFTVWDVSNRAQPRQLTVAWRDQNNNSVWDPQGPFNFELVFIYSKTYDPTGTTQFAMPPNALPNECTVGPKADIVYCLSLYVLSGHVMNESPGTLYLRPTLAPTSDDRFAFNPTIGAPPPELPTAYALYQNYPNPFNPATTIKYELPVQSTVTLTIYTILGQKVKTLVSGVEDAGVKQVQWDGRNERGLGVATGVYFYRLEARAVSGNASFTQVKKMLLLR
jgi:hypothetical protein